MRPADEITDAFEAARTAGRIAFRYGFRPLGPYPAALARGLLGAVARRLGVARPDLDESMTARGVMELDPPRFMMDFGHFAVLGSDGRQWSGRSGRPLASLPSRPASHLNPLWLVALAAGAGAVAETGDAEIEGARCRCLTATVDLDLARTRAAIDLATPRATEPSLQRAEFCIDVSGLLRRVRVGDGSTQSQVELTRYAIEDEPPLDWGRLPSFEGGFP